MDPAGLLRYWCRTQTLLRPSRMRPARYANLLRIVRRERARRLLEIGTHDGTNALQMIQTACLAHPAREVEYFGFDLFEGLTEERRKEELALRPPAEAEVLARLRRTGVRIRLFRGDSRETLPRVKGEIGPVDLVFIDGGHSQETIRSDWENALDLAGPRTVIVLDDYLENEEPEAREFGCQWLVDDLDREAWDIRLLDPVDSFRQPWGILRTRMVAVRRRAPAP